MNLKSMVMQVNVTNKEERQLGWNQIVCVFLIYVALLDLEQFL